MSTPEIATKNSSSAFRNLPSSTPIFSEDERILRPSQNLNSLLLSFAQRVGDILFSTLVLIALFPLMLIIALAIVIDSKGPVLFVQSRIGKDGIPFMFYKFRSMVADAEAQRHLLEKFNERNGPVFKMKNDPRITRVGRLLRKYSLDELPQFLNVVRGEMSVIGPRPALPKEVATYNAKQRGRLLVRPGITGLWQVSGRAHLSFEESVELDLHYVENQSILLNLHILFRTVFAVLSSEGAY